MTGILLLAVAITIYFTPLFVAVRRNHPNTPAIVAVNLLLGWTFIGWVIAYVWAVTAIDTEKTYR